MKLNVIVPILSAAFLLTACDDKSQPKAGVGVAAKISQGTDEKASSKVGADDKIEYAQSEKASASITYSRLIAESMNILAYETKVSPAKFRSEFAKAKKAQSIASLPDEEFKKQVTVLVSAFTEPNVTGWPCGSVFSGMRVKKEAEQIAINFGAAFLFLDQAYGVLGSQIKTHRVMKNPVVAKQAVTEMWTKFPVADIKALWTWAVKESADNAEMNFFIAGGGSGMKWTLGRYNFEYGSEGAVVISNGTTLFGQGVINGKEMKLALESGEGVSTSTSTSRSKEGSEQVGQSVEGSASVGQ